MHILRIWYTINTRASPTRRGPALSSPVCTWRSRTRCWYPRLPARVFAVPVACVNVLIARVWELVQRVCMCVCVCFCVGYDCCHCCFNTHVRGRDPPWVPLACTWRRVRVCGSRACPRARWWHTIVRVLFDGGRCAGVRTLITCVYVYVGWLWWWCEVGVGVRWWSGDLVNGEGGGGGGGGSGGSGGGGGERVAAWWWRWGLRWW